MLGVESKRADHGEEGGAGAGDVKEKEKGQAKRRGGGEDE